MTEEVPSSGMFAEAEKHELCFKNLSALGNQLSKCDRVGKRSHNGAPRVFFRRFR